jgi:hypothetical protein
MVRRRQQQPARDLHAGAFVQIVEAEQKAVVDHRVIAERRQVPLDRHALREAPFGGGERLAFCLAFGKPEPGRSRECAAHADAHEAIERPTVGPDAKVHVAHHRRRVVDLAMRGDRAGAVVMYIDAEIFTSARRAQPLRFRAGIGNRSGDAAHDAHCRVL